MEPDYQDRKFRNGNILIQPYEQSFGSPSA
jgi:hypothetical protein